MLFARKCIIFVLAKRKEPETQGSFLFFCPNIKEEKHRKLEILNAFADFLNAFADFLNAFADFLNAFAVREMTM